MGSKLMKFLTNPSKIAGALDWKRMNGSIMTLDIGRDCIDVAIASHPLLFGETTPVMKPVTIKFESEQSSSSSSLLTPDDVYELQSIVEQNNVCGFVVTWPIQKEGRCGAPCGRVLHTLDHIAAQDSANIFTPGRKFCLWDRNHVTQKEDAFGRNPIYGEACASTKTEHIASIEQYGYKHGGKMAAQIWTDFCHFHWPFLQQSINNDDTEFNCYESDSLDDGFEDSNTDSSMKAVAV